MGISQLEIGNIGLRPNGCGFIVTAIDLNDQTVMAEDGTWYLFADCDFSQYEGK